MSYLRIVFVALLSGSALLMLTRGSWEGHLVRGNHTSIISLSSRPVWSPPPVPSYETFRETFTDLPLERAPGTDIVRVFRYDAAVFGFLLLAVASAGLCGLLHLLTRRGGRDAIFHYALFIAIGFIAAAATCFVVWLVVGGWGPPFPLAFALLGIGFGIYLGKRRWKSIPVA
jgi:hypothetical protein